MGNPENQTPKSPASHLHAMNLIVAMTAGIISIVGGVYTLKSNIFSGPSYGSLQGIVRDAKIARPLVLASVEITGADGAVVSTVETDDNGHYSLDPLKTGNYIVKFTASRHIAETKTVKIEKDLKASVNVDLVPETVQANTVPVEQVPSPARIGYPSGSAPVAAPRTVSKLPYSTGGEEIYYGQGPSRPARPGSRHPYPRGSYSATNRAPSSASQSSALTQMGVQLVEALTSGKSGQNSTSGS